MLDKWNHKLNTDMTKTRKAEPKGLAKKMLTFFPICELLGRVPSSLLWSPVPYALCPRSLQPPGQALRRHRGSVAWAMCCNSWGDPSACPPSLRSPKPLYIKQPPQPGLDFREAVSEEAAARDFSMCFQVKSKAFQLCQETNPPFPTLAASGREGCKATSSQTRLPCLLSLLAQTPSGPHPTPGTVFPSAPTPSRRGWSPRWGTRGGA